MEEGGGGLAVSGGAFGTRLINKQGMMYNYYQAHLISKHAVRLRVALFAGRVMLG